jgi:hypothetical protein
MKLYSLFFLTAISNIYVILILWGFSAGFSSYIPQLACIAAILLFVIVTPLSMFNGKWAVILGLSLSVLMLPFNIGYFVATITEQNEGNIISLLFIIPAILNFCITVYTGFILWQKRVTLMEIPYSFALRVFLAAIPIFLFTAYLFWLFQK